MKKIKTFILLLSLFFCQNMEGQGLSVLVKQVTVNSDYKEINRGRSTQFVSFLNLGCAINYESRFGLNLQSGFQLVNKKTKKDPSNYMIVPLKILLLSPQKNFSLNVGLGVFYGISISENYTNDKGINCSAALNYHFNSRYSITYELEYYRGLNYVRRSSGGGSRDYRISSFHHGIGITCTLWE